jgi:phosphoesterase RecJ-like protein
VHASASAIAPDDWDEVVALLRTSDEVVLACHVHPDGDALGSMLAVAITLHAMGTRVYPSFGDDPFVVPRMLRWMPGQELLVPPAQVPRRPRMMITFDTGQVDRLGLLAEVAEAAETLIVVDHHISNTGFGTHHLVDPDAPAAAVMAARIVKALGVGFTRDVASLIYVGVSTDTGSFRYAATTPATHRLAAELLEAGIPHEQIARRVWDDAPFPTLQLLATVLSRATLEPEAAGGRGLVWAFLTDDELAAAGIGMDDVESFIDVVRRPTEAQVAVLMKGSPASWQVSTRSKGDVDVSRVCGSLGGGGHRAASGFTGYGSVDAVMAQVCAALDAEVARLAAAAGSR